MATLNLGAIRYNWKGAYNSSTDYVVMVLMEQMLEQLLQHKAIYFTEMEVDYKD